MQAPWSDCLGFQPCPATLKTRVPRLIDLVASYVSERASLIESSAATILPNGVYPRLLSFALKNKCYESAKAIVSNYPDETMALSEMGFSSAAECTDEFMQRMTTTVVRAFIASLEENCPLRLRTVDMRGYPLGGPGLSYLAVHSLLSYKEAERRKLLSTVQTALRSGSAARYLDSDLMSRLGLLDPDTLPDRPFHFIIDGVIDDTDDDLFQNVCMALKTSHLLTSAGGLRVTIAELQLSGFHAEKLAVMLELLNQSRTVGAPSVTSTAAAQSQQLTGLALHFCDVGDSLDLRRFPNLTKLEVLGEHAANFCDLLCSTLPALTQLDRLSLNAVNLGGRVGELIGCCPRPLEMLTLNDCQLRPADVTALSDSDRAGQLRWLELRRNRLDAAFTQLGRLLTTTAASLQIVVLRETLLGDEEFPHLGPHLLRCADLRRVDLTRNRLNDPLAAMALLEVLAGHPTLTEVLLDLPHNCFSSTDAEGVIRLLADEELPRGLDNFQKSVDATLASRKGDRSVPVIAVVRPAFIDYTPVVQ
uniref:Uncharacterized protein n=1 Tax=Plectus sambesii TaxID=2011161 RepID=A0A914W439_9BILA